VRDVRGLLGLAAILAVAFLVSNNRGRIPWRTVAVGLAIQVAFAALVLRWSVGRDALEFVADQARGPAGDRRSGGRLAQRGQQRLPALEGKQQQVDHAEG
jgi:hypothetical protein